MAKRKQKAPKAPDALPRCLNLLQVTWEYADAVERLSTDKASQLLASLVKDNVAEVLYHLEGMAKA